MNATDVTVSPAWVQNIVNFVETYGVKAGLVWSKSGINSDKLDDGQRLSMDETVRLWAACVELSGDEWFGLHLGRDIRPNVFHIVGYTLMNSENLAMALQRLAEYQRLVSDGGSFQRLPSTEGVWLIYHSKPQTLPFLYHQIDAVLSALLTFSQWVCNEPIYPIQVSLQREGPEDTSEYLNVFGVRPLFAEKFDGILVPSEVLERPLLGADPDLCKLHELYARCRLDALTELESFEGKVERLIEREIGNSMFCRKLIADQFSWSEKKLQRQLALEGLSFKVIQDKVRRRLAISYVSDTLLPLNEVSEILGFSDSSAFNRAFKRWENRTPGEFRRAH